MKTVQELRAAWYPQHISESNLLDKTIQAHLQSTDVMLDLGCGSGRLYDGDYRGLCRRVIGVDQDPAIRNNETVIHRISGSAEYLPIKAESIEFIYSRYVVEHLKRPEDVFAEIARVLRPGGTFVLLTPNVWHYVTLLSHLTPQWFHTRVNTRLRGRRARDTFPTLYRANTRRRLRQLAAIVGLREEEVQMIEVMPNYLMWARLPFLAGVLYERIVNSSSLFEGLRVNILAVYRKPSDA